jgi:cysteine desulfurase
MTTALEIAHAGMAARWSYVQGLRDCLVDYLRQHAGPIVINGSSQGSPYTLNVSFPGCRAESLLIMLDLAGIACSTGSACSSGSLLPSPTLQAMGCSPDVLHSAMRFSFSHQLTGDQILESAAIITDAVRQLRRHAE